MAANFIALIPKIIAAAAMAEEPKKFILFINGRKIDIEETSKYILLRECLNSNGFITQNYCKYNKPAYNLGTAKENYFENFK